MSNINLYNYIESINNFPKKGILFRDISPLLANFEAISELRNIFLNEAGSLDGVFNNAGTTGPVSKIQDLKPNALEELVKTNVIGAYYVAQNSAKIMIKQRKGNIVNMTSIAADIGGAGELIN